MDLCNLPYDIVEKICEYLSYGDQFVLVYTFGFEKLPYFDKCLSEQRKADLSFDFRITKDMMESIFGDKSICMNIKSLDLTGIYWIDSRSLNMFINRMKNVNELYLLATNISLDCANKFYLKLKQLKSVDISHVHEGYKKIKKGKFVNKQKRYWRSVMFDETYVCFKKHNNLKVRLKERLFHDEYINDDNYFENLTESGHIGCNYYGFNNILRGLELFINKNNKNRTNFLYQILSVYTNLHSLKIINHDPQFTLFGFKPTDLLVDFSYECIGHFAIDQFFLKLNENNIKLQRLHLKFDTCVKFSQEPLSSFLNQNPQLIFVYIECNLPERVINLIQSTFNCYKKSPQHIFEISKISSNRIMNVPFAHYDLMGFAVKVRPMHRCNWELILD